SRRARGRGVRTARSPPRRRARPAPENPDDREEGPALMPRARLARMSAGPSRTRMDDVTVERVLRVVEAIPPGQVAAYGEIGAIVGVGPRLVGRILRTWGAGRSEEHMSELQSRGHIVCRLLLAKNNHITYN